MHFCVRGCHPVSRAATGGISVDFFSSGYLDVSVPPVPFNTLWIGVWITELSSAGFPNSDISGSMAMYASPKHFAAYHVHLRLPVPRHSPCALSCLTFLQHKLAFVSVLKTIAFVLGMIIYSEIKCWLLYYILFFNKFLDFIDSCLSCIQFSRCILSFCFGRSCDRLSILSWELFLVNIFFTIF